MKRNHFSQLFTLILGVAAAMLITACSSCPSPKAEPVQHPRPVKYTFAPSTKLAVAEAAAAPTPIAQARVDEAQFKSLHYQAGTLLQGSSGDIFYLTAAGTRRRVPDQATLLAFGLAEVSVVKVNDALLDVLPLAEALTPLVWAGDSNLYWVAQGQRWLVNEWKPLVTQANYSGVPATRLDNHLEQSLPVRLGFANGTLLRAGQVVYYFDAGSIIPTPVDPAAAAVLDVPAEVLAAYTLKPYLTEASLPLNAGHVAEVRQGPGPEQTLLGVIAHKIMATGRSQDGRWLRVNYLDQSGWLAAEQIADPIALSLLPTVRDTLETGLPSAQPLALSTSR